jgi:hypothetical protein
MKIVIMSSKSKSRVESKNEVPGPCSMKETIRSIQNVYQGREADEFNEEALVGASILDVARLLAAVANTLGRGLGRAVARQVANLSTCCRYQ